MSRSRRSTTQYAASDSIDILLWENQRSVIKRFLWFLSLTSLSGRRTFLITWSPLFGRVGGDASEHSFNSHSWTILVWSLDLELSRSSFELSPPKLCPRSFSVRTSNSTFELGTTCALTNGPGNLIHFRCSLKYWIRWIECFCWGPTGRLKQKLL